jgi:hypothetical protein
MRLYSITTSEAMRRPARKGGDRKLKIELSDKGIPKYEITFGLGGYLFVKDIPTGSEVAQVEKE